MYKVLFIFSLCFGSYSFADVDFRDIRLGDELVFNKDSNATQVGLRNLNQHFEKDSSIIVFKKSFEIISPPGSLPAITKKYIIFKNRLRDTGGDEFQNSFKIYANDNLFTQLDFY